MGIFDSLKAKMLIKKLEDTEVREDVVKTLEGMGESAVKPLIKALKNEKNEVKEYAAKALGAIGDVRAVEPLIQALNDGTTGVRRRAVKVLGAIGDERAVEPLIQALNDEDLYVQQDAADALGEIGERAVESLIRVLKDEHEWVQGHVTLNATTTDVAVGWKDEHKWVQQGYVTGAVYALGKIGDARAVEPLIQTLKDDENRLVRGESALSLGNIRDDRAVEPLIQALKDENEDVRGDAAIALGRIGYIGVVEPLIQALKDENEDVRGLAADALGKVGDARAVEPLIQTLKDDETRLVRGYAAEALRKIRDMEILDESKEHEVGEIQEYIDNCMTLQYSEIVDERIWDSVPEIHDLGDGSNLSGDEKKKRAESLIVQYPDFDHVYRWSGIYHNRGGDNNKAKEIIKEGLKVCKRKYNLYEELGNIEYQNNHLLDAVHWWIQSILSQKSIGQHDNRNPFLYLSYICGRLDLNDIRSELSIYAAGTSLAPQAANEVYHRVDNETKMEYIRQALLELHRYLESEY